MEMYRIEYKVTGYHANCSDNLSAALRELGVDPKPLPSTFNLFMNANVGADGRLTVVRSQSVAGNSIVLRAEMDLAIALSSCPASTCNGGAPIRSLAYEILPAL